jgi:hypothetical protein
MPQCGAGCCGLVVTTTTSACYQSFCCTPSVGLPILLRLAYVLCADFRQQCQRRCGPPRTVVAYVRCAACGGLLVISLSGTHTGGIVRWHCSVLVYALIM